MTALHRLLRTFEGKVNAYIAFTEFSRQKFIAAGLPADRIFLKPHFLSNDPGAKQGPGTYALLLGRLVEEKGILTLLKAWQNLKHIPLRIAGSGRLESEVRKFTQDNPSVSLLPYLSQEECFELIKGARFLVWPSEGHFETFGLVAIEAFACGVPVIASRLGAMAEIVAEGRTGLHFAAGDEADLAAKLSWAWTHPEEMGAMGNLARAEYLAKYTAEQNYPLLMDIYQQAQRAIA
jgi:glycosyltransferase involved in cell wall biosynthesis